MNRSFTLVISALLLSSLTSAQDLDPHFVKTPPDYLIYGSFLRNEAAFEKLARQEEQGGRSGNAYRAHFISLYGLSASEQNTIAAIALEHDSTVSPLRAQKAKLANDFRQEMFPDGRHMYGTPAPARSPEIQALRQRIVNEELATRERIHQALGDARFRHLDGVLRARAQHDFKTIAALTAGGAQ